MSKKYQLTQEGLAKIKKELADLIKARKAQTKGEIPEVLHSEELNPEYLDFREKIQFLEKRISKLEDVVKHSEIIRTPKDKKKVQPGAKIIVETDGQEDEFMIVGPFEADPARGKISYESLVGNALLGHKQGEEVKISARIEVSYKIKEIEY